MKRLQLSLIVAIFTLSSTVAFAGRPCNDGSSTRTYRPVIRHSHHPTMTYRAKPAAPAPTSAPAVRPSRPRSTSPSVMGTAERLEAAKAAFRIGHNNTALAHASMLIQELPNNSNLLQFRSMVYFRQGDFRRAAQDAYEAVQHGPIWNASVVESLYAYPIVYKREIRSMREDSVTDVQTLFLSAYHHLVSGQLTEGRDALQRVLWINPDDKIAAALIRVIETSQRSGRASQVADTGR